MFLFERNEIETVFYFLSPDNGLGVFIVLPTFAWHNSVNSVLNSMQRRMTKKNKYFHKNEQKQTHDNVSEHVLLDFRFFVIIFPVETTKKSFSLNEIHTTYMLEATIERI